MNFSTPAETMAAGLVMLKWLPELLHRTEERVLELGFQVEQRAVRVEDGVHDPVLLLRKDGSWKLELRLRNALEDFLLVDREETPVRMDVWLFDHAFAERKLADVIKSRMVMVSAISESRDASEVADRIRKHASKNSRYRIWRSEDESEGG